MTYGQWSCSQRHNWGKAGLYRGIPLALLNTFYQFSLTLFPQVFFPEFLWKAQKERCQTEKQTRSFRFDFDKLSIAKECVFPLVLQYRDRTSLTCNSFDQPPSTLQ